jgi:hypothetical protein
VFKGANILLLSRSQSSLDVAVREVLAARKHMKQTVSSHAVDLAVHRQVSRMKLHSDNIS